MKIVYMGTPDFAVPALEMLHREGFDIAAVVSQPDKPKGRHGELSMPEVKKKALELGLTVLQPQKASDPDFIDTIRAMEPDAIVVAAYGQILKPALLSVPRLGCINIHASLLPRWRGAAPIAMSIVAGDEETGVTTMYMEEGLDTGDILLQDSTPIDKRDTAGSLTDRLSHMGAELIVKTLRLLSEGQIKPIPQDGTGIESTYAHMLRKEDGDLELSCSSEELDCRIRGLSPWPGAFTRLSGKMFKIHEAEPLPEVELSPELRAMEAGAFGINDGRLYIRCGSGALRLLEVQLEGKKRMPAEEFLRGSRSLIEKD